MDQKKLQLLYDRMEIIDTINRYANSLLRTPAGWRINKYKVVKTWMTTT